MKKNIPILFLAFILVTQSLLWVSCDIDAPSNEAISTYDFLIQSNEEAFHIKDEADLAQFIKHKAAHENITVESATFEEATDDEGVFQVIKGKYKLEDSRLVSIVMPLNLTIKKSSNQLPSYKSDCIMTCTAEANNEDFKHIIQERCKRQTSSGSARASVSVSFDD